MENENECKVGVPARTTDETWPLAEGRKDEPRVFEFVYAEICGCSMYAPEKFVRMDGSEREDIMPGNIGLFLRWGVKNYGFGEYSVRFGTDGKIEVQDECSGPEFSKALFAYLGQKVAEIGEHDHQRDEKRKQEEAARIAEAGEPDA